MKYQNPQSLHYYLLSTIPNSNEIKIIDKQTIPTTLGLCELAIIGSSHYFAIENIFCEMLTCSELKNNDSKVLFQNSVSTNFQHEFHFEKFTYKFQIEINSLPENLFFQLETELFNKKESIKHAFSGNSALTVLQFSNENALKLATWHTYPESFQIVKTLTICR